MPDNKNKRKVINKTDLIKDLSKKEGFNRLITSKIFNDAFNLIKSYLAKGYNVRITNFGEWLIKTRKSRKGRNPQTGKPLTIHSHNGVSFKVGKSVKNSVK